MSGSVNKVILVGNLGADPEVRSLPNGGEVANLRIATSESWKDKTTGERQEKTEWHSISVFNEGLVKVCKSYLKKGSKIYVEGQLQTRQYDKDGQTHYRTEIVLSGFNGQLTMLDGRNSDSEGSGDRGGYQNGGQRSQSSNSGANRSAAAAMAMADDGLDDVPF